MTEARNGRTWIPEEYLDEVTPPGRASPDAWLEPAFEGGSQIARAWDADEDAPPIPVEEGQVVAFMWCDEFGAVKVQFKDDGTFKALGPVDPRTTHFWQVGDPGSLADSLEEMAKIEAEEIKATKIDGHDCEFSIVEVQMATWAEKPVRYRLVIERGAARFIQIAGAN